MYLWVCEQDNLTTTPQIEMKLDMQAHKRSFRGYNKNFLKICSKCVSFDNKGWILTPF